MHHPQCMVFHMRHITWVFPFYYYSRGQKGKQVKKEKSPRKKKFKIQKKEKNKFVKSTKKERKKL